jgi:hypothetical protein
MIHVFVSFSNMIHVLSLSPFEPSERRPYIGIVSRQYQEVIVKKRFMIHSPWNRVVQAQAGAADMAGPVPV